MSDEHLSDEQIAEWAYDAKYTTQPDGPWHLQERILALAAEIERLRKALAEAERRIGFWKDAHAAADQDCEVYKAYSEADADAAAAMAQRAILAERRAEKAERERDDESKRATEYWVAWQKAAAPWCICEEGPYYGAQLVGTPLRCERCGRDERQTPLAHLRAKVSALADHWLRIGGWLSAEGAADDLRALIGGEQ